MSCLHREQACILSKAVSVQTEAGSRKGKKDQDRTKVTGPSSARPTSTHYSKSWCYRCCRLDGLVSTEALAGDFQIPCHGEDPWPWCPVQPSQISQDLELQKGGFCHLEVSRWLCPQGRCEPSKVGI